MTSDFNEDRAYEMGDPTGTRYLQEDEEEEMPNMYQGPRRTPITEDWLARQAEMADIRRAATRERRKYHLHYFLTRGWLFLLGLGVVLGAWAVIVWVIRQVLG